MIQTQKIFKEAKTLRKNFSSKIKTIEEIQKIIGSHPRNKKVIMCYGTFDIVHPGHIRQLIYAKTKGDILIVDVTVDKYASARSVGPYVPHELRALNIAAFEMVDYVVIDPNPTPIDHILKIKPDYYVKGFEYSAAGSNHPRSKEELDALSSYGGKIVFSPGDVIYSSSTILAAQKPNLSYDQLINLMEAEGINFSLLRSTISKFKKLNIHVVGDLIVDKYSRCTVLGPAQKTAAFSIRLDGSDIYIGGAGVVAQHLKALGADVTFTTIVGDDELGKFATAKLKDLGIKINALVDSTRPTTTKERFLIETGRLVLQVDQVDNTPISENLIEKICQIIEKTPSQAIVCSDFRHGIFNAESISKITWAIPPGCIKIADSQVSNRWGNILDFNGFDLITPNEREARFALGDQDTTIRPLSQMLYNKARCRYLILKMGGSGIMTYRSPGMESREFFYIDSFAENIVDPIGAGDALLSAATLSLIVTKNIVQASILGNFAAAIECSKLGNIPVSFEELIEETKKFEKRF